MPSQFTKDYVNKDHINAFARALKEDGGAPHITSQNDWAPVNLDLSNHRKRRRSRKRKTPNDDAGPGLSYALLRWPLLLIIGIWIILLTIVYVSVRVYVASYEYLVTWRGHRRRLREELRNAPTYQEWVFAAKKLDQYLGYSDWKSDDPSFSYYDYRTVTKLFKQLRYLNNKLSKDGHPIGQPAAEITKEAEELCTVLQGCVKYNFAGTQGRELYSQCYYGTKDIVEEYNHEVVRSLNLLTYLPLSVHNKRLIFKQFSKNYGKSALCLSGGACFSYRHFGVVKALLQAGLLPNIISGTSGGGLVAALAATRTNSELEELLVPELADKITACWEKFPYWIGRWYRTGARFDAVDWAERTCWFTMGSMTFLEAFKRTGRILNISTVPADPHSPAILCNYITSPNAVIWSTLLASAAVPGILNPVVLMMKTKTGDIVPYSFGSKWKDGSLRTDIPTQALNMYFNVNFTIVSQVNPHISLFFYAPQGTVGRPVSRRRGKGWRGGFVGSALENIVKLEIQKWLKLMKNLKLFPRLKDQDWSNVWLQKFAGSVTIWPKIRLVDLWHILDDPTREAMAMMISSGEKSTYPRLLFIRHFVNIERAIEHARKRTSRQPALRAVMKEDLTEDYYHSTSADHFEPSADSAGTSDTDSATDDASL